MRISEDMKKLTQEIVSSYENRVSTVTNIVSKTQQMLEEFKAERNRVNQELKEMFAREKCLRRKDFDHMMKDILSLQELRESQIKGYLDIFLDNQQKISKTMQNILIHDEQLDTTYLKRLIEENRDRQEINISQIKEEMQDFQKEYKEILKELYFLLEKGETIQIKEIKKIIANIYSKQQLAEHYAE